MEMFPAANDDQWTLIRGGIDLSDYYIVIVRETLSLDDRRRYLLHLAGI
jgi:hypothetical protein